MPVIISNASPLIALSNIGQLQILQKLWEKIIIPEAVYREVVEEGAGKPGAEIVSAACNKWITVTPVSNANEVKVLRAMLDAGESEVIVLGQELKAQLLLLDNREPRLFANELNLNIIGTMGIIKLAWKKGLINDPVKELQKLKLKSFWISDSLMNRVRSEIEEAKKDK